MGTSDQSAGTSEPGGGELDRSTAPEATNDGQAGGNTRRDRLEWWTELIAIIILSIATLGVAWSGYQSARWGGVQSIRFAEAGGKRVEANRAASLGYTEITVEISMFTSWLEAYSLGQTELADRISQRFPDEFKPAFAAWIDTQPFSNPDAAPTPFDMPEYWLVGIERQVQLEAEANELLDEGKAANQQSDDYVFNTVILVSVLFFAGIAQRRFRRLEYRVVLTVLGSGMLIYGLVNIFTYPVT